MTTTAPPPGLSPNYPLARLTTIRTGGSADYFARAGSTPELIELLAWAGANGLPVGVIGSGSNLLIADQGVHGVVLKLSKDLAGIAVEGDRLTCGGGARFPQTAARAAGLGLQGLEFAVNIPGTVGGAVKMNANAYGGELAEVLVWAEIVTAGGSERRAPADLGFAYRRSNLKPGEVVASVGFELQGDDPAEIKARMRSMRERRKAAQPAGIKTFGSTFKNPASDALEPGAPGHGMTAGELLEEANCRGLEVGGARFSPKHANFVENMGAASTADVVELIKRGRERVAERFGIELETEVQVLGAVKW